MGAGQQSRVHCTRLACDKADKWLLQQHPKTLRLQFKDGLQKPEKANIVDQFLLWDQLSEIEKRKLCAGLVNEPIPITAQERGDWVKGFAGICLSSDAFIPFADNLDRAARSNVRYRRPSRRLRSRRRGHRRGGAVRHDHGPHRAAAVPALAGSRSPVARAARLDGPQAPT